MPDYTQADLAEARALAPELGTKAQERIARALAERERLGALKEWARRDKPTVAELRQLIALARSGELAEVSCG